MRLRLRLNSVVRPHRRIVSLHRPLARAIAVPLALLCQVACALESPPIIVDEKTFMDVSHDMRSSGVSADQRERILANLSKWKAHYRKEVLCAVVVGHSDVSEAARRAALERLAQERTQAVAGYLLRHGFTSEQVQTYAAGPDKPAYEPPSMNNQRTEIEVFPCTP